jgi:quinol monooxygenase YgiN
MEPAMTDDTIHVFLNVATPPEKSAEFRALMAELVGVAEAEPGTLMYEWWFDADGATCHIHERYRDRAAGDAHVKGFVETYAGRFFGLVSAVEAQVYGDPSDFVRAALAPAAPVYRTRAAGFSRFAQAG